MGERTVLSTWCARVHGLSLEPTSRSRLEHVPSNSHPAQPLLPRIPIQDPVFDLGKPDAEISHTSLVIYVDH